MILVISGETGMATTYSNSLQIIVWLALAAVLLWFLVFGFGQNHGRKEACEYHCRQITNQEVPQVKWDYKHRKCLCLDQQRRK